MPGDHQQKTMEILKKHGFRFKKKWGQNFLLDKNMLKQMAKGAHISHGDSVVEIGAGAGTLTRILAAEGARVLAIEIDPSLIPVLNDVLAGVDNVTVVQGDALKMDLDELARRYSLGQPYKIVANLPYYITTPIVMNVLENEYYFDLLVIMVQWEVASRLTAQPGSKEYGAVTVAIDYYTEAEILFKVPRYLFTPAPDVDSAVICLKRRDKFPVEVSNKSLMFRLVRAAFNQRRKTLANALKAVDLGLSKLKPKDVLAEAGIDSQRRGETLSLQEFARLANTWQEYMGVR